MHKHFLPLGIDSLIIGKKRKKCSKERRRRKKEGIEMIGALSLQIYII